MNTKEAGPKPRHAQGESGEDSNRASASIRQESPSVNISRRSPLVPACFLSLIGFAVLFLSGHVIAALTGWHFVVYVGVGLGIWWIASCFVAFCAGAVHRD